MTSTLTSPKDQIVCAKCVMDTTDPDIQFDEQGVCNHCRSHDQSVAEAVFTGEDAARRLQAIVERIKKDGANKKYDCVIGVSGGVDSTYVAYQVKQLGLRPLAVHLDNGWDSELAVKNIENTLTKLNIELYTYVIDWIEFRDIQLSFLKASTPDSEIPSDHAIQAIIYQTAERLGISHTIWGDNHRTETHLPSAWSQGHRDWKYIASVHKQFGSVPIKTFPHLTLRNYLRGYGATQRLEILNYLDYVKKDAMLLLQKELDWKYYGGKHYESVYTRFYQGYILPKKFGFDKRKSHLSSLICSGEITRDEALRELENETYPADLQEQDREYVIKKLGLIDDQFEAIMNLPKKTFWDYDSYAKLIQKGMYKKARKVYRAVKSVSSRFA
ncbi:MAG TPA: N-acetyl sugar amidotransferase [Pyrinomonadaceae bacterium]|nr:N-acetyl sugar amidotransferase [Pyrinomonadaceae bacterium]